MRLKTKLEDLKVSDTLGGAGERGDLRIGMRIRGERFGSVRGECVI